MDATSILQTLNAATAGTGVSCELKRRTGDTSYRDATQKDFLEADLALRCKAAAAEVEGLSAEEKLSWSKEQRKKGNVAFAQRDYREALMVYMESLMGLEELDKATQLAVAGNMAVCCFHQGAFRKCLRLCDACLELEAEDYKAWYRRGMAHKELQEHGKAKDSFEQAEKFATNDAQRESCQRRLYWTELMLKKDNARKEKMRQAYASLLEKDQQKELDVQSSSTKKTVPLYDDKIREAKRAKKQPKMSSRTHFGTEKKKKRSRWRTSQAFQRFLPHEAVRRAARVAALAIVFGCFAGFVIN